MQGETSASGLYAEGFREIGLDPLHGDADAFVESVRQSRIRPELETSLDEWQFLTVKIPNTWARLWEIGAKLHPDEPWRRLPATAAPKAILERVDLARVSPCLPQRPVRGAGRRGHRPAEGGPPPPPFAPVPAP